MKATPISGKHIAGCLMLIGTLFGCTLASPPDAEQTTALPPPEADTAVPASPTPGVTEEAVPVVESLRVPEVASTETQVIYEQAERASLDGFDTMFWPDGTIGFVPLEDGQYRFFAPNGDVTARTVGTFDDPGAVVEASSYRVEGASDEFAYLAGGPVYRDPATGMLILFYHAERHFGGPGIPFHAALGLAASNDEGQTFQNLGIILETNAVPDVNAVCCADMGGATFTIKDEEFYLYFRDRRQDQVDIQLALATAPVDEVVAAAQAGTTSEWTKYSTEGSQPGIGGIPSMLENGNPQANWFGVSYNTLLDRFIMAVARNGGPGDPSFLYLVASEDGITWSPRLLLQGCDCDLIYPNIIDPGGNPLETGETFYLYYVTTPPTEQFRWHNSTLNRMTVTLTGQMVEMQHEWEFEADPEGWTPLWDIGSFEVVDGSLVIEPTGIDPYMQSPSLGLSSTAYTTVEIRMKVGQGGTAQIFFTGTDVPGTTEDSSVRFPLSAPGQFVTYTVDMSEAAGWSGIISTLRLDPTDKVDRVDIDFIRLLP